MARIPRTRTRTFNVSGGFYGSFTRNVLSLDEFCSDFHGGPRVDSNLTHQRANHHHVRVSGIGTGGISVSNFVPDNWIPGGMGSNPIGFPTPGAAITQALANSNPNRRTVDMPVFLYELADIPEMLKNVGEGLLEAAFRKGKKPHIDDTINLGASANLAIQFGWLPLISDIGKMLDAEKIVDKRFTELKRLHSRGGLRRRFTNFESTDTSQGSTTMQTSNFNCVSNWMVRNTGKVWTTLRWKPDSTIVTGLPESDAYLRAQARRATLDLYNEANLHQDIDLASVWEAIPFSWLVDYFANVGDVLKATRNQLPVTASAACVMSHLSYRADYTNPVCIPSSLTATPGHHTFVKNVRTTFATPSPSFSAAIPLLGAGQLSILGSLAALLVLGGKPGTQL